MDINNLINDISKDLEPVKPIRSRLKRFSIWIIISSIIIIVSAKILLVSKYGLEYGNFVDNTNPLFIFENALILISGVTAAIATFRLSVPLPKIRNIDKALISIPTLIWVGLSFYSFMNIGDQSIIDEVQHSAVNHHCLSELNLLFAVPVVFLFIMLKKAATTSPGLVGYAAILSVTSLGALAMRYVCSLNEPLHLFAWHFAPILIYALIGTVLSRFILKW